MFQKVLPIISSFPYYLAGQGWYLQVFPLGKQQNVLVPKTVNTSSVILKLGP